MEGKQIFYKKIRRKQTFLRSDIAGDTVCNKKKIVYSYMD